jgi:hypothetical protein
MAAPVEVYSATMLKGRDTAEHNAVLLPLCLAEYGSKNFATSYFYLDDVIEVTDKAGRHCFIGLVRADSGNYNCHHANRIQRIKSCMNGVEYFMLNDGGLNTFPYAIISFEYAYANRVQVRVSLYSAYYSSSFYISAKLYMNSDNNPLIDLGIPTTLASRRSGGEMYKTITKTLSRAAGETIRLLVQAGNDETQTGFSGGVIPFEITTTLDRAVAIHNMYKLENSTDYGDDGSNIALILYLEDAGNMQSWCLSLGRNDGDEADVSTLGVSLSSFAVFSSYTKQKAFTFSRYYSSGQGDGRWGFYIDGSGVITKVYRPYQRPTAMAYIMIKITNQLNGNATKTYITAYYIVPNGATAPTIGTDISGTLQYCDSSSRGIAGGTLDTDDISLAVPASAREGSPARQVVGGVIDDLSAGIVGARASSISIAPTTYRFEKEVTDFYGDNLV